jgi:hypothetical protein
MSSIFNYFYDRKGLFIFESILAGGWYYYLPDKSTESAIVACAMPFCSALFDGFILDPIINYLKKYYICPKQRYVTRWMTSSQP